MPLRDVGQAHTYTCAHTCTCVHRYALTHMHMHTHTRCTVSYFLQVECMLGSFIKQLERGNKEEKLHSYAFALKKY